MTDKILAASIANQASFAKLTNLVMTVPVTRITAHKQKVPKRTENCTSTSLFHDGFFVLNSSDEYRGR